MTTDRAGYCGDVLAQTASASGGQDFSGLVGWVADVLAALGSIGVGLLTFLEVVFPPVPSEVVLPLAGYLASQDRMVLVGAVVAATIGSTLGALGLYWAGRSLGVDRMRRLIGRVPLMDAEDLDRAQEWFSRHDQPAVFIGRMVPGVRSLISLPAGFDAMPLGSFTVLTFLGSAIWNGLLIGAGYLLGRQWQTVGQYSDWFNYAIYAALAFFVVKLIWERRGRLSLG